LTVSLRRVYQCIYCLARNQNSMRIHQIVKEPRQPKPALVARGSTPGLARW